MISLVGVQPKEPPKRLRAKALSRLVGERKEPPGRVSGGLGPVAVSGSALPLTRVRRAAFAWWA